MGALGQGFVCVGVNGGGLGAHLLRKVSQLGGYRLGYLRNKGRINFPIQRAGASVSDLRGHRVEFLVDVILQLGLSVMLRVHEADQAGGEVRGDDDGRI